MTPSDAFDQDAFLGQQTDEQGSTVVVPVPAGEYLAIISDVIARPWSSEKTGKSGISIDIAYDIQDDSKEVENAIGRPPKVTQGYFCDLTSNNLLDFSQGKNIQLNRVREAVRQNVQGQVWQPTMLKGQPLKITVKQEPSKQDSTVIFNRVTAVGAA